MFDFVRDHIQQHIAGLQSALLFSGQDIYEDEHKLHVNNCIVQYEHDLETRHVAEECLAFIPEGVAMKANFETNEILGITVYMITELIEKLKRNRLAMLGVFLVVALGVSALIAYGVTTLTSYGPDNSAGAMAAEPAGLMDVTEIAAPAATPTQTAIPAPAVIVLNVPAGEWTEETCSQAGEQMNAEMASFWTSPQGSGCNVLVNGAWSALP
jgi:hypothetical protein